MPRFRPGQSGNPSGRPRGSKNKATKLRESIAADLPQIVAAMVTAAKDGDVQAARLLLDRAIPALKPTAQPVAVPGMKQDGLADKAAAALDAAADGQISPDTAAQLVAAVTALARIVEVDDLERRITEIEARYEQKS